VFAESLAFLPPTMYPFNTNQSIAAAHDSPSRRDLGLPAKEEGRGEAVVEGSGKGTGPGRARGQFVWACFNRNLKIKPGVWRLWMQLLREYDGSVLWLRRFHIRVQENLQRAAEAEGVARDRLVFAGRIPNRSLHLARHREADLFVDTAPFGGHSTLADVVWAGVPVLVLPCETMGSRIGSSIMSSVGAAALVARNLDEYLHLARVLAAPAKAEALAGFRKRIQATLHSDDSLQEASRYTKRLEGIYTLAWETFRARRRARSHGTDFGSSHAPHKAPPLIYTRLGSAVGSAGGAGGRWVVGGAKREGQR
jgi:hypothetical protein